MTQVLDAETQTFNSRLNWLRAGVLGANDGIVSIAALVIGVAAAAPDNAAAILTAGIAGIVAGALSMGAGEYVSVSTQRDAEKARYTRDHSGYQDNDLTNPWHATVASIVAFTVGALPPMLAIVLSPVSWQVPITFATVVATLAASGYISALLGDAPPAPAVRRNVLGGATAMVITFIVGSLVGTHV